MNSLVQRIANRAQFAFSLVANGELFPQRFVELLDLVNRLRNTDLNIINLSDALDEFLGRLAVYPRVLEIVIAQNEILTMRVFILRNGWKIPVHDHPNMHVILKIISGTVEITSYSLADEHRNGPEIPGNARVIRPQNRLKQVGICRSFYVDSYHMSVVFTPTEGNFYEIRAVGGDAAFFEIVAPSYDMFQRPCKFYKVTESINLNNEQNVWLSELPYAPDEYWGRPTYTGPIVQL